MSETLSNQAENVTLKTEIIEGLKLAGKLAVKEMRDLFNNILHPFTSRTELRLQKEEPPLTPAQREMAIAAARHTTFSDVEPNSHDH